MANRPLVAREAKPSRTQIERLAASAIMAASRPRGTCPTVIALALGVLAVPCAGEDAATLIRDVASARFRYAWVEDKGQRARSVWRGLARVLLLRASLPCAAEDAGPLAKALARENRVDMS